MFDVTKLPTSGELNQLSREELMALVLLLVNELQLLRVEVARLKALKPLSPSDTLCARDAPAAPGVQSGLWPHRPLWADLTRDHTPTAPHIRHRQVLRRMRVDAITITCDRQRDVSPLAKRGKLWCKSMSDPIILLTPPC
jgi:hypothetical protein